MAHIKPPHFDFTTMSWEDDVAIHPGGLVVGPDIPQKEDPCGRTQWWCPNMGGKPSGGDEGNEYTLATTPTELKRANLYGSLTRRGLHAPALDIDFPARLLPSSTPGHFHLYLDKEIPWEDYARLIQVLGEIGILEIGNAMISLKKGMTTLRKPGVTK